MPTTLTASHRVHKMRAQRFCRVRLSSLRNWQTDMHGMQGRESWSAQIIFWGLQRCYLYSNKQSVTPKMEDLFRAVDLCPLRRFEGLVCLSSSFVCVVPCRWSGRIAPLPFFLARWFCNLAQARRISCGQMDPFRSLVVGRQLRRPHNVGVIKDARRCGTAAQYRVE